MITALAGAAALLFVITMGLKAAGRELGSEYVGVAFHLALLPIVSELPAPAWASAAGYAWLTGSAKTSMLM